MSNDEFKFIKMSDEKPPDCQNVLVRGVARSGNVVERHVFTGYLHHCTDRWYSNFPAQKEGQFLYNDGWLEDIEWAAI